MHRHLSYNGHSSPAKMVLKGESKCCESQTVAAPKAMAEILFNCSILCSQRQNLLKKIVNATTQRTREEASSLVAAVIPADAHGTNSLMPVRFEFGPLPHWVQPQVPTSCSSASDTKFSGSSFPISSTCADCWVEEDPYYTSCQAGGTHNGRRHKQCHHVSFASLGSQPRTHP